MAVYTYICMHRSFIRIFFCRCWYFHDGHICIKITTSNLISVWISRCRTSLKSKIGIFLECKSELKTSVEMLTEYLRFRMFKKRFSRPNKKRTYLESYSISNRHKPCFVPKYFADLLDTAIFVLIYNRRKSVTCWLLLICQIFIFYHLLFWDSY